jgi:hypothetical protein
VSNSQTKYRILSCAVDGLLHGQYSKFRQRISPVVVASDILTRFYIKYCPRIVLCNGQAILHYFQKAEDYTIFMNRIIGENQ